MIVDNGTRKTHAPKWPAVLRGRCWQEQMHAHQTRKPCSCPCCESHVLVTAPPSPTTHHRRQKHKTAFEAQRMEIAALHTAGERAVVKTSRLRRELDTSEKELTTLEREMHEIG